MSTRVMKDREPVCLRLRILVLSNGDDMAYFRGRMGAGK